MPPPSWRCPRTGFLRGDAQGHADCVGIPPEKAAAHTFSSKVFCSCHLRPQHTHWGLGPLGNQALHSAAMSESDTAGGPYIGDVGQSQEGRPHSRCARRKFAGPWGKEAGRTWRPIWACHFSIILELRAALQPAPPCFLDCWKALASLISLFSPRFMCASLHPEAEIWIIIPNLCCTWNVLVIFFFF